MIVGKDREETVRLTAEALGESLDRAEMIVAFELGEITGDVVDEADEDSNAEAEDES
jgi:hypothetical protein